MAHGQRPTWDSLFPGLSQDVYADETWHDANGRPSKFGYGHQYRLRTYEEYLQFRQENWDETNTAEDHKPDPEAPDPDTGEEGFEVFGRFGYGSGLAAEYVETSALEGGLSLIHI